MKKTFYFCFCVLLFFLSSNLSYGQPLVVTSPAAGAVVNQCGTYFLHFNPGSTTTAYAAAEVHLNDMSGPIVQTLGYPSGYLSMNYDNVVHASGLTVGNNYQIKVYDAGNPSNYAWSGVFTVAGAVPPTSISSMLIDWGWLEISWPEVVGASSYGVDVATSSNFTTGVVWNNHSALSGDHWGLYINSLAPSTTYYIRIKTYTSACGTSGYSSVYSFTTLPCTPPAPTANAATNVGTASFTANWTSVSRASNGYDIVLTRSGSSPVTYSAPAGTTSLTIDQIHPSSNYSYTVTAKGSCTNSSPSNAISFSTSALLAPTITYVSGGSISGDYDLYVHWNQIDGADSYQFQVSLFTNFSSLVIDTPVDGLASSFRKSPCSEYYVRVQSIAYTGETSAFSTIYDVDIDPSCGALRVTPDTKEEPIVQYLDETVEPYVFFPNPSDNYITVAFPDSFNAQNLGVQTIDSRGNSVTVPFNISGKKATFDLSNVSSGLYVITMGDGTTKHRSKFLRK